MQKAEIEREWESVSALKIRYNFMHIFIYDRNLTGY